MRPVAIIISVIAAVASVVAQVTVTTRQGKLRPRQAVAGDGVAAVQAADTAALRGIRISAYDKPLRSLRETFFVTNTLADTIVSVSVGLTYTALADTAMLHRREATVGCVIPPGETRQLYLTAWDRQFTYYYKDTRIRPRSSRAVAYDVAIRLTAVSVAR